MKLGPSQVIIGVSIPLQDIYIGARRLVHRPPPRLCLAAVEENLHGCEIKSSRAASERRPGNKARRMHVGCNYDTHHLLPFPAIM